MGPEILIPVGRVMPIAYGKQHRISRIGGGKHGAAVFQGDQLPEIAHVFGGRASKPTQQIVLIGPDGRTPVLLMADGETEAAELEEMALAVYERGQERIKKYGQQIPIAEYRERRGLPRKEEVPAMVAQAFRDRMAKHRANFRTDPARVPRTQV